MTDQATTMHHLFDDRLDALKSGVHKLIDKATTRPTWFGSATERTAAIIKAHPFAAIGIALGLGYIVVRAIRR